VTTSGGASTLVSGGPHLAARPPAGAFRHPGLVIGVTGAGAAIALGAGASIGVLPGLLVLAGIPLALLSVMRPDIGALTLVAAAPVLSGLRRDLPVPGLRPSELLIGLIAGLILLTADRRAVRPWRSFDWLALGYALATLGLGLFGLLARGEPLTAGLVGTLIGPFQYFVLYRAVIVALPHPAQRRRALQLLLLASVPVSVSAILQHFHVLGVRELIPDLTGADIDADPELSAAEGGRATGTFPHWQVLAGYEFWIVALGVAAFLERRRVLPMPLLALVLGLAAAGAIASVTMTVVLGAVAAAVLLGAWYRHLDLVVPVLLIGAVAATLAFGPSIERRFDEQFGDQGRTRPAWVPATMDYRYRVWRDQFVPALEGYWWTGYGPDLPPSIQFDYTESLYFTLLVRGGVPLTLLYFGLIVALLASSIRARDDPDPTRRATARTMAVAIVLLVPMHWVEPYFVMTGMATLFWITAALLLGGDTERAPRPTRPARRPLALRA
jgi:hypothetical protein